MYQWMDENGGREPGKMLNPAWVSRMMGLPDGWLDIPTRDGEATP